MQLSVLACSELTLHCIDGETESLSQELDSVLSNTGAAPVSQVWLDAGQT